MNIISLSDIKNKQIVDKIQQKNDFVTDYLEKINSLFPGELQVMFNKMIYEIRVSNEYAYENDGNTKCEGKKYKVFWSFPFTNEAEYDWFYYYNNLLSQSISFVFEVSERVHDGKITDFKSFEGYIGTYPQKNGKKSERFFLNTISKYTSLYLVKKVYEMYEDFKILQAIDNLGISEIPYN